MRPALTNRHEVERVEFDGYNWFFRFSDGESLRAGCLWRVLRNGHISLTSNDHGQLFGLNQPINAELLATAALAGKEITSVAWDDDAADLSMSLSDLSLQLVTDSSGYESWDLFIEG
jgi:hypothetical protein